MSGWEKAMEEACCWRKFIEEEKKKKEKKKWSPLRKEMRPFYR